MTQNYYKDDIVESLTEEYHPCYWVADFEKSKIGFEWLNHHKKHFTNAKWIVVYSNSRYSVEGKMIIDKKTIRLNHRPFKNRFKHFGFKISQIFKNSKIQNLNSK